MPPPLRCSSSLIPSSSSYARQVCRTAPQARSFSTTLPQQKEKKAPPRVTKARRGLYRWLRTTGVNFENPPAAGHTNYLGAYDSSGSLKRVVEAQRSANEKDKEEKAKKASNDAEDMEGEGEGEEDDANKPAVVVEIPQETTRDFRPFPLNPQFISQPVLGEEFREKIWNEVMVEGESVRDTSAKFGIEMNRVGAVIRLKEVEKEWIRIGKPTVQAYADAVLSMLPTTKVPEEEDPEDGAKYERKGRDREKKKQTHETINDLPIHPATGPQIFYPTSESRVFTRADAAKVFDETLKPADERVPHPELALMHKDFKAGLSKEDIEARQRERDEEDESRRISLAGIIAKGRRPAKEINTPRFAFKFTEVNAELVGKDGRGVKATGWRYGMPLMDRSRAQVKIPTRAG